MTNSTKRKESEQNDITRLSSSARSKDNNKRVRLAGIRNLGNTCFMNSVLQCLSNIRKFTSSVGDPPGGKTIIDSSSNGSGYHKRKLMQIANVNDNSKPELLFETLRNTIYLLKKSGKSFIIPESLFTMIGKNSRFRGYQQQDAHEFLRYVLDRLDKECLENRPILEIPNSETKANINYNYNNTSQTTNTKTTSNNSNTKKILESAFNHHHSTMIGHIFGGILQNEVNCLQCGFKSHKQDPFLDLSLDIPQQQQQQQQEQQHQQQRNKSSTSKSNNMSNYTNSPNHLIINNNSDSSDITTPNSHSSDNSNISSTSENTNATPKNEQQTDEPQATTPSIKQPSTSPTQLMDCLSSFIELEELLETELYYCSNCRQKQRSTKRFWIRRLPDVLCLHLKRFRYNNFLRTKIDDYVQFPIHGLDMKRFVITNKHETRGSSCGPTTYDLNAFIEHHGTGLGSGHYTAYCQNDGYWFHLDDSSVTACDESTVRQSKAYILFYTRRTS